MLEILRAAKAAAEDKKAKGITALGVSELSHTCDYHFICSGESERQVQAIVGEIEYKLKKDHSFMPRATEGKEVGNWISLDYGSFFVHVFLESARQYYALEELWPNSEVDLSTEATPSESSDEEASSK